MRLTPIARAILLALPVLATSALADGPGPLPPPGPRADRLAPARPLPPEVRYRDPRYAPPPRRPGPRLASPRPAGPTFLIEGYLPRYTDVPMYNEPPSRFPSY